MNLNLSKLITDQESIDAWKLMAERYKEYEDNLKLDKKLSLLDEDENTNDTNKENTNGKHQ